MVVVHGTKKLRDRVPAPPDARDHEEGAVLGDWYATVMFTRPQIALFVNARTLLPLLMRLAPARTLLQRLPTEVGRMLQAHGAPALWIEREVAALGSCTLRPTSSRQLLGVLNEFAFLTEHALEAGDVDDLTSLSLELSATPMSPLYPTYGSPDRALASVISD